MPAAKYSVGTPTRSPSSRSAVGSATGSGSSTLVASRGSWPDEVLQQERAVVDGARERADLVERAGEGDQPVAADGAVGGLQADDAAERGRLADGAAGVGAERPERLAGGDGGGGAAAAAAGHGAEVPRVAR